MQTTRLVRATTVVLAALTALSLVGCQPGSSRNGKKRHKSSSSSDYKSSYRDDSSRRDSSSTWTERRHRSKKRAVKRDRVCNGDDVRLTVQTVARSSDRFLVRAVNISGRTCRLGGWPHLRFDASGNKPRVAQTNRPVSELKLRPRASGYAAVQVSGSGSGTEANAVDVALLAPNRLDLLGDPVTIRLPHRTTVVEPKVGYWRGTPADAQKW